MNKKHILAFSASNSKKSINKKLVHYTVKQLADSNHTILDLNDFEMPIYSIDREQKTGIPELAIRFKEEIKKSDGIIISFAEHNGAYSTAFKNIFDWISRIEKNVWDEKPMFLMATAPGPHGGKSVLEIANMRFRRGNKNTIVGFSLPSFNLNFSEESGITNAELKNEFDKQLEVFEKGL